MLVDITPRTYPDPILRMIAEVNGKDPLTCVRHMEGVWEFPHWNPEHAVEETLTDPGAKYPVYDPKRSEEETSALWRAITSASYKEHDEREASYPTKYGVKYRYLDTYGVCDNPMQILARWPHLIYDPTKYVIALCKIEKRLEHPEGGWRWHKWGSYIGVRKPKCEYLVHEPNIDSVYTFHIYEVG